MIFLKKRSLLPLIIVVAFALFSLVSFITIAPNINFSDILNDVSGYNFLRVLAALMPMSGYVGLFLLLLLENASAPIPGELLLPVAGYYVFVGQMSIFGVLGISSLASVLGSLAIFMLASKLGAPGIYWVATKIGISQKTLAKNEVRLFGKYGTTLVALSRFVPILGSTVVLPAGALRMNSLRFALLALISSFSSSAVYLLLGYSLAPILQENKSFLSGLAIHYILVALVGICISYIVYYVLRMLKEKKARTAFVEIAATERSR